MPVVWLKLFAGRCYSTTWLSAGGGGGSSYCFIRLRCCLSLLKVWCGLYTVFSLPVRKSAVFNTCYAVAFWVMLSVWVIGEALLTVLRCGCRFLRVVEGRVGLLSLCSVPFPWVWMASHDWAIFGCSVSVVLCISHRGHVVLWWAVRLKVGCILVLWQGRPFRFPPYLSPLKLSSGHWRLSGKEKGKGVSRSSPYMLRFWYSWLLIDSSPWIHLIYLSGRPVAGSSVLQLLFPEKSYAGVRDMFSR